MDNRKTGLGKVDFDALSSSRKEDTQVSLLAWTALQDRTFLFLYRAVHSAANSKRGLIKGTLSQLCAVFPEMETQLAARNSYETLKEMNLSQFLEVFCDTLSNVSSPICAFIDGLDECTGDYFSLTTFLATLQDRASIKICLGSRPEAVFKTAHECFPSLAMQDHNSGSFRVCIEWEIRNARDALVDIDSVTTHSVRQTLHDRAQGVMIWIRLAMDELVKAAATGITSVQISEILDDIPEGLEELYSHTFFRIHSSNAQEVALLLYLINELDGSVALPVLYGFWSFYAADFSEDSSINVHISQDVFGKRLHTLLGSFVD